MRFSSRPLSLMIAVALCTACAESPLASPGSQPRPLTAAEERLRDGSNGFAWDLLREAGRKTPTANVFVSPLSVSMALGMTASGARGGTGEEMRTALGFGDMTQEQANVAYRGLKDLLLGLDPSVEMLVANSIWYEQSFPFDKSFFDEASRWFDADVTGMDFAAPDARDRINRWVKAETRGRIPTLVEQIRPDHVMFLINAVYFKGNWTTRFDRAKTADATFTRSDGSQVRAKMMRNPAVKLPFARGANYSAADLPYGTGAFAMTVVVPDPGVRLDDVATALDSESWKALTAALKEQQIAVVLPRLKLEWKDDLKTALKALGIRQAFSPGAADFTGMSASHGHDLVVTEVMHKTFLEVNEEGTEAAAATSVGMGVVSLAPGIYADRPFLLVIRERTSGSILFVGRIEDPTR